MLYDIATNYCKMFNRLYHVSCVANNIKRQSLQLNKMLNPKAKRHFYPSDKIEGNFMPGVQSLTKLKNEPGKRGIRRLAMLNKLFMKHITDILCTGTVAMSIVGRGIEISKVKVSSDLQTVNVYWVGKGNTNDAENESLLNKTAGALRHELSTLRAMGEVPYVVFVKDKQEARVAELDYLLANADYGEDYTPTDVAQILKTEFTLDTKLSPEMKAKIRQLEDELKIAEEPIPEMTHTVYGLDHEKIMNRLLAARKKSKDAWINLEEASPVISYSTTTSTVSEVDVGKQKKELAEFLMKRQILQSKLRKQMRETREDWLLALDDKDEEIEEEPYDEMSEDEEMYESEDNYCTRPQGGMLQFKGKEINPKL